MCPKSTCINCTFVVLSQIFFQFFFSCYNNLVRCNIYCKQAFSRDGHPGVLWTPNPGRKCWKMHQTFNKFDCKTKKVNKLLTDEYSFKSSVDKGKLYMCICKQTRIMCIDLFWNNSFAIAWYNKQLIYL